MKQFIVLISMIALGLFLHGLIAGDGEDSLRHGMGQGMRQAMVQGIEGAETAGRP
ncbi:MAG: hypothetical protein LBD12_04625 [Clostridiales Family XIII bacterium]|jgi:hypothetical protein|nr:hypothetical protein [Clostridiales Family XIII bacterium]